ncbi:hypothetical protein TNIN_210751 [Trichonephila inaurata madagascariensis]|uniref:Uncharacterized protein n=1 Tax=Trichonephila inaurata madagascariensis TaxID=2747483 RepID=A0A8X7CM50_9ARAC|nr:hypothetical protein TNIN_210751 [Trichonephila inaurata madagascariensis]
MDGAGCAEASSNISDVRGQVEDIILGNRERRKPGALIISRSGPDEGSGWTELLCEARPTFPDVRGQVEDIILGNRETQNWGL